MEVKHDFKKTEIGLIPNDWELMDIGEIFTFKNGLNKAKEYFGLGTPIVNYMDVFKKRGLTLKDIKGKVTVSNNELKAYNVKKGDVFFTRTSETVDEIGITSVILEDPQKTVFSGFILRARPYRKILDLDYCKYCFSSYETRKQITSKSSYTTRALTNGRLLSSVTIPIPTKNEQQGIAKCLSDLDNLIISLDRMISKKRAIKQGAMQQLLTGKKRLPGFADNWKNWNVEDVFSFMSTANNPRSDLSNDGEIGYIHYGDIHTKWSVYLDCCNNLPTIRNELFSNATFLEVGDLIIADASEDLDGIGKSVEVIKLTGERVIAGLHTILLRGNKELLADGFKGYIQYIPSYKEQLRKIATGISVYGISKSKLAKVQIFIPSIPEQKAIAFILKTFDREINALIQQREKTELIKKGLMQELLTGKTRLI